MTWLLETMATNAIFATILAVIVFGVTRFVKKPPVVYWLWLLVLVKLVTPPVLHLPLKLEILVPSDGSVVAIPIEKQSPARQLKDSQSGDGPENSADVTVVESLVDPAAPSSGESENELFSVRSSASSAAISADHAAGAFWKTPRRGSWGLIVGVLWFLGSSFWFALAAFRVFRFERFLRQAEPASAWLQQEADGLAQRFGLRRCPQILVVHGRVPPLLWSMRRSSIVAVPSELLDRLEPAEQLMVIAHELVHFRRRDHWFRRVEMAILGLYFWHPVAWWARRQLQEAEEQCCDAWVLWAFPENPKDYARALLSTIEFLSASQTALPAGASGFGTMNHVQRRFEMILQNRVDRRTSWCTRCCLLLLACAALGLSTHIVLAEPQESEPADTSTAESNPTTQTTPTTTEPSASDAGPSTPSPQKEETADFDSVVEFVNVIKANKEEYQKLAKEQKVAVAELEKIGVYVWQYEPNRLGKLNRQLPVPIRDGFQNAFEHGMLHDVSRVSIWKRLDEKQFEYVLQQLKIFPQLNQVASLEAVLLPEQIERVKKALPNVEVKLSKVFGRYPAASQTQARSIEEAGEYAGVQTLGDPDKDGMVKVTFQPSPHSTLEKLVAGEEVFISQTLRPISPGFDYTPIIAERCKLVEFWKDRSRPASNQPVVLLVKRRDVAELQRAEEAGTLEVHASHPKP